MDDNTSALLAQHSLLIEEWLNAKRDNVVLEFIDMAEEALRSARLTPFQAIGLEGALQRHKDAGLVDTPALQSIRAAQYGWAQFSNGSLDQHTKFWSLLRCSACRFLVIIFHDYFDLTKVGWKTTSFNAKTLADIKHVYGEDGPSKAEDWRDSEQADQSSSSREVLVLLTMLEQLLVSREHCEERFRAFARGTRLTNELVAASNRKQLSNLYVQDRLFFEITKPLFPEFADSEAMIKKVYQRRENDIVVQMFDKKVKNFIPSVVGSLVKAVSSITTTSDQHALESALASERIALLSEDKRAKKTE